MGLSILSKTPNEDSPGEFMKMNADERKSNLNMPPNPQPDKFKILNWMAYGNTHILKIKYEGVTNYEGVKILVFDCEESPDTFTVQNIYSDKPGLIIDPHFSDDPEWLSPVARFEPTHRGWRMATACAKDIEMNKFTDKQWKIQNEILTIADSLVRKHSKHLYQETGYVLSREECLKILENHDNNENLVDKYLDSAHFKETIKDAFSKTVEKISFPIAVKDTDPDDDDEAWAADREEQIAEEQRHQAVDTGLRLRKQWRAGFNFVSSGETFGGFEKIFDEEPTETELKAAVAEYREKQEGVMEFNYVVHVFPYYSIHHKDHTPQGNIYRTY